MFAPDVAASENTRVMNHVSTTVRVPFGGGPLTGSTFRIETRAFSERNRGRYHEVSAETRWESCAYTAVYSPRSAATAGEQQGRPCLLGFLCESTIFDSRGKSTIGLMGAAARRDNLVPHGGKGGKGLQVDGCGAQTSQTVGKLGWRASPGRSCHVRQRIGSLMAPGGTICRHVLVQSLYQGTMVSSVRKNHDAPRTSGLSDPDRQGSRQKMLLCACFL